MNTFGAFITFSALVCVSLANPNYPGQYLAPYSGQYAGYSGQYAGYSGQYAGSYAAPNSGDYYQDNLPNTYDNYAQSLAGNSKGKGDIIYPAPNPCPEEPERGEVIVHKPAPIIVNRPPTKVTVNHPPVVVKPAPVVFRKPPSKTIQKPVVQDLPRRVQVEPVYLQVSKPAQRKVFVEPQPEPCPDNYYYNNVQSFNGPIAASYGNAGQVGSVSNVQNYANYPSAASGQTYYANSKVLSGPDY